MSHLRSQDLPNGSERSIPQISHHSELHRQQLDLLKRLIERVEAIERREAPSEPKALTVQDYSDWDDRTLVAWQKSRTADEDKVAELRRKFVHWFKDHSEGPEKWSYSAPKDSVPIVIVHPSGKDPLLVKWSRKENAETCADFIEESWPLDLGTEASNSFKWDCGANPANPGVIVEHLAFSYSQHGRPEYVKISYADLEYIFHKPKPDQSPPWGTGADASVFGDSVTFYNVASISFSRVAFVLSHYDGFFEFAMNFLLCYAWPWKCHSISINSQSENPLATNPQQLGDIFTFQIHVRYIVLDTKDRKIPIKRRPGVQLMRQSGWLLDNDKSRNAYFMREARASIAVKIPLARPVPSCFSIISFAEGIEAVADDIPFEYSKVGQLTGMHVVLWKLDHILGQSLRLWNKVLDALDTKLRVTIETLSDRDQMRDLMFDQDDFRRSKQYFHALQLLRIFSDWIEQTIDDIDSSHKDCIDRLQTIMDFGANHSLRQEDITVLDSAWQKLGQRQQAFNALRQRIERKQKEVDSLRNGLLDATQVRDSSRATSLNRYILIFTVMTVFYLPLTFVTTVFGMHLFDTDDPKVLASHHSFYTTMIIFAVGTYATALITYPLWRLVQSGWFRERIEKERENRRPWTEGLRQWNPRRSAHDEEKSGEEEDDASDTESRRPEQFGILISLKRLRLRETMK